MATYTWNGTGDADWSVAADWNPAGGPPGAADTALIPSGGTVSIGETQSIGTLNLAAGASALISAGVFTVGDPILAPTATIDADGGKALVAGTTFTDLPGIWIANDSTIALPQFSGIAGYLVLDAPGANLISSTDSNAPSLINSYLAPETILPGAGLYVDFGATFGITRTPLQTVEAGGTPVVTGGSLLQFGNAGYFWIVGGTANLTANVTNTGTMKGYGTFNVSGAVMDNSSGTIEALGGLLTFAGAFSGGDLAIDTASSLELAPGWFAGSGAVPVTFAGTDSLLQLDVTDTAGAYTTVGSLAVGNFAPGDTIIVAGTAAGGDAFNGFSAIANDGTTLSFIEAGDTLGTLSFAGGTAHLVQSTGSNGSEIITAALPASVVNTTTLTNPNGAASDYALYNLEEFDGSLYAGGWLNGQNSSPSNPDGIGLDRIYVSSSPTLDDFSPVSWTNGQSPGTWNDAANQTTLYNEVPNPGTDTYTLVPYYGPTQPLGGSSALYYQVNDETVVNEGGTLVMFVSAVPSQNEYPATTAEPNGNPNYQVGWCEIGYATSTDGGASWTWQGTLPLLQPDGTPLLAPVTQAFPTDPSVPYQLIAAGNGSPTAIYSDSSGLDLWYSSFQDDGSLDTIAPPVLTLSAESTSRVWSTPRTCSLVTNSGTTAIHVSDQDVALADDGTGTLWMAATQWQGPNSGDIMLYYSSPADGTNEGVNWHPWDGASGALVVATNTLFNGLYDLVTPDIVSIGGGTLSLDYSVPTVLTATAGPSQYEQINQTFALPCFAAGTRILTAAGEAPIERLRIGDRVAARGGRLARIAWIGHRHAANAALVRVAASAFAAGVPHRTLYLSPDHAVFVNGALVPVRYLVNGAGVLACESADVGYWHVELAAHDVMFADGLACESYLDTGNRAGMEDKKAGPMEAEFRRLAPTQTQT